MVREVGDRGWKGRLRAPGVDGRGYAGDTRLEREGGGGVLRGGLRRRMEVLHRRMEVHFQLLHPCGGFFSHFAE